MTVFEYLRKQRMLYARQLLRDSTLSIIDIARTVGFANSGNFSTAFKERYSKTPQQFRNELRNQ